MSNGYIHSAQTSIAISIPTTNPGIAVSFRNNGIALQQSVDPVSGRVSPDWTVAANQPVYTPEATTTGGGIVSLMDHYYAYNDVPLSFNGAVSGGFRADSTNKFAIEEATGAIKIIDNLASLTNIAGDTLVYKCTAAITSAGKTLEFKEGGKLLIDIVSGGESSYYGALVATTQQLTTDTPSAVIRSQLGLAGSSVSNYYPRWFKHTEQWEEKSGQKDITVTRDDIDGGLNLVCKFFLNQSDTTPVSIVGLGMSDRGDEMVLRFATPDGTVLEPDPSDPTKVLPIRLIVGIFSQKTNAAITPTESSWKIDLIDTSDMSVIDSVNADTITVTSVHAESTKGGIEAVGNVQFNI